MTVGLRIRDSAGNVVSDPTHYWGRILHKQDIAAGTSGSYSIPDPGSDYGQRWHKVQPVDAGFAWASTSSLLSIGVSGTTVTYSNASAYAIKVIHGIN